MEEKKSVMTTSAPRKKNGTLDLTSGKSVSTDKSKAMGSKAYLLGADKKK